MGVCGKTLTRLRKREDLPYHRIGGRVLYSRDEVGEWLRTRRQRYRNAIGKKIFSRKE
ncbi:helix-turn-helix domain-containing protein [Bdellovibrio bacteriovorus]|uniref:helix-turn-helix domain-containing protein n=1 Tax=Bdellovibrio bacteriovorus TaxID=959 RepID=UPI0035A5D78E